MEFTNILLTTLNSSYQHAAFGLRYLYANMGNLQNDSKMLEFTIAQSPRNIAEKILSYRPKIVTFSVYIWNTTETHEVISILKAVSPDLVVVVGGPEVSYESEVQSICILANFVIKGEGDFLLPQLCQKILSQEDIPNKFISGDLPDINKIKFPYQYYNAEDIKNRVIYVEASRGCPYKCEYCLSSLDKQVRNFPVDLFLLEMEQLIVRGARQFKFVDRTFNLNTSISTKILQFFLARMDLGIFLHFEMVPDRLPEELRKIISKFPAGSLQFEIGIQTWNPFVSQLVSRRQDYKRISENFNFLRNETNVHTHADLIVGLPGETIDSFAHGFDALVELGPDEIQVGILKRLKGTPIIRHDKEWHMIYSVYPPFQILSTKTMDYFLLQKMNRFAKFWDLFANSGNFLQTLKLFKKLAMQHKQKSIFWFFYEFCEFLSIRHPESHGIALLNLLESVWLYLTAELKISIEESRTVLVSDYTSTKKRDIPYFLREKNNIRAAIEDNLKPTIDDKPYIPLRQRQHLQTYENLSRLP